jgi:hypothetical protein
MKIQDKQRHVAGVSSSKSMPSLQIPRIHIGLCGAKSFTRFATFQVRAVVDSDLEHDRSTHPSVEHLQLMPTSGHTRRSSQAKQ